MNEGFSYLAGPSEKWIGFSFLEMEQVDCSITVDHWSSTKQDLGGSPSPLTRLISSSNVQCGSSLCYHKSIILLYFNSFLSLIVSFLYCDFYGIGYTVFTNVL